MSTINLSAEIAPGGPFAIVDDTNIRGGYRVVADTITRDAIIADDLKVGMLVSVQADGYVYKLASIGPAVWTQFNSGSGGAALASTAPANVDGAAAAVGVGTTAARADHKHNISVAAPINIGTANAQGSATTLALSDHVHNLPFTPVQTALGLATGDVSLNAHKLTNVAAGTVSTDAVNKSQLDTALLGLHPKANALTIAEVNVASLSGVQTINGVALVGGNRVLLTAQTTASQNGAWVVQVGAWTRPTDFATGSSAAGSFFFVEQGTVDANTGWVSTNSTGSDVVDTNSLTFARFSTFQLATATPLDVDNSTALVGTSSRAAKEDHKHSIVVATPIAIGAANSQGSGNALALANHVHSHGVQSDPTFHALAVANGANGFLAGTDKAKIDSFPALANIAGAVIVEDPSGSRIGRRLTQDDIDPSFAINSFATSQGTVELGTIVSDPSFTATYNSALASATLDDGAGPLAITLPAGLNNFAYNAGVSGLPHRSYQKLSVNGAVTWTLTATKLGGTPVKTAARSVNLGLTRRYYNVVPRPGSFDEVFVKTTINQNLLGSAPQGSYNFPAAGAGKRIYFAWPTVYGTPTFKDGNGFQFSITRVATGISFTNTVSTGFSIPGGYDIWESDNEITVAFVVNVT